MKTHIAIVISALRFLWGLEGIWVFDRLRLWRKSINLYLAFLAFTDSNRPRDQLDRAMFSAILSAVYDYDTDWTFGSREGKNFLPLLNRLKSRGLRKLVHRIFRAKVQGKRSHHDLERGSMALWLYRVVIDSAWMKDYTREQILDYGRKLQIIDDLLDLEADRAAGDKNCLLLEDQAQAFIAEAEAFLESEFFVRLKSNSRVYGAIEKKTRARLRQFRTRNVTFGQLFATGRPNTGLYAFLLSLISFGFYRESPALARLTTALAFAGLTMSIMVFNDWMDREHDRKKGKLFGSEHPKELLRYWLLLSCATVLLTAALSYSSLPLALFTALIWIVGILYSFTRRWYIMNNLTVALCSGSPALCGAVFHAEFSWATFCTFLIFASLMFINEQYKDVEDRRADAGYKQTLPVRVGTPLTFFYAMFLLYIPGALCTFHPNPWVQKIGGAGIVVITFWQAGAMLHPEFVHRPMRAMRILLKSLIVALLAT